MNNSENIIVIYKEVGKKPVLKKIKNNVETFELILGGKIEILQYEDIQVICKKDRDKLLPNVYLNINFNKLNTSIRGNFIIVSMHNNTFKSLTKNQAIKYGKLLVMESFNYEKINTKYKYLNSSNKFANENKTINSDKTLNLILDIQRDILKFIRNINA